MPDQFWSLTMHEFGIKHAAFSRAEARQRALIYEYILQRVPKSKSDIVQKVTNRINALRRYAVKPWLKQQP